MKFTDITEDFIDGLGSAVKAHRLDTLTHVDEYHLALAFFLSHVTKRIEMDEDEANIATQKCLYALGFETNEVPVYLEEGK